MKSKTNNLVLFVTLGVVFGFLIGFLIFNGFSSTGNAKAVTKDNIFKNLQVQDRNGTTFVGGELINGQVCIGEGKSNCYTNVLIKLDMYDDVKTEMGTDSFLWTHNNESIVSSCRCVETSGPVIAYTGKCSCGGMCANYVSCVTTTYYWD